MPSDREQGIELGIDSRPEYYVPAETKKRWKRTCKVCGKTETTSQIKTREVEEPNFGS